MIYFVGGAPRAGKSILTQRLCRTLNAGWISTDMLLDLFRFAHIPGCKDSWDAAPEAISANAEWFFPYLERFTWGASSLADHYIIEGVDFLPAQLEQLSARYAIRAVFLGRSRMTLDDIAQFPGRSEGYSQLPEARRRQIAEDVPRWSAFIRQEAAHFSYPYIDMVDNFQECLTEAEMALRASTDAH